VVDTRLLRRLTQFPNDSHVRRVEQLLTLLREVTSLESQLRVACSCGKKGRDFWLSKRPGSFGNGWTFADPSTKRISVEYEHKLRKANELLRRYRWHPIVHSNEELTGLRVDVWDSGRGKQDRWENVAVAFTFDLLRLHVFPRIRRCRQCQSWFYAITDHQLSCGANCRKKFSSTSPKFKEKRRVYMALYRQREKERDNTAKRIARPGGR